ncbi:glycosyltransferase family 1 protein [Paenibacillus lycopersici]|uniref:Glycosyltransferase family 1 protein n=1 Tax=Paenibacillus lycopersici TaxID=2704462 RepID=A0A6C0FYH0_9BACL|nr:glycosyltransferase [Paenibacillus lycopersici]QHT59260.1 glycosyltransferase family 1 protein [Paenibacillus lycopersici]
MRILYFSTVNWKWIKQRPHFIAHYLSLKGYEVDYFSLNPIGKTKIRKFTQGRLRVRDTYVIPFALKYRFVEALNAFGLRAKLSFENYHIIIVTHPFHLKYIPARLLVNCLLIYECMDNMPYFYEGPLRERILAEERKTLNCVDTVITSSNHLRIALHDRSPDKQMHIETIPNALDRPTFRREPKRLILQEPNLIYIGTISDWMDMETIRKFASIHLRYTIYLIGPAEIPLDLLPNMVWLGVKKHDEIIDYIYSGNIMLLPFLINELTEAVDPVKIYEYLSLKKPVISSYWAELGKFEDAKIKFYCNYQDFENRVFEIEQAGFASELDSEFVELNNWEVRVERYAKLLYSDLKAKKTN